MIKLTFRSAISADNIVSPVEIIVNRSRATGIRCAALDDSTTELIRKKLMEHGLIEENAGFNVGLYPNPAEGIDLGPVTLAVTIAVMLTANHKDNTDEADTEICVAAIGGLDNQGNAVPADMNLKDVCGALGADLLYAAKGQKGLKGKDNEYDHIGDTTVPIFENVSTMHCILDDFNDTVEQKLIA